MEENSVPDNASINNTKIISAAAECAVKYLRTDDGKTTDEVSEAIINEINERLSKEEERNRTLRKLQLEELEILKAFDKVCRKHNLRYYIVGGCLIGAVRHGGFVPWDDDIDVSMPRKDFEKLLRIAPTEFKDEFFLQNQKTEKNCYFYYAKLRKNGTYFGEDKFEHIDMHKGIFIDIFPLDYVPDMPLLQCFFFKAFSLLTGFICSKEKTTEFLYKNMSLPFIVTFRLLQCILPKFLLLLLRSFMGKLSNLLSGKKYVASLSGFHGYPKEVAPAAWWGDGTDIEFEGVTVRAPAEYKTLLTHMFGDYMQLPPEEERINHMVDSEKIIFSGCTKEDYKAKIIRKRSHRYYGCDYDVYPVK